jgi:hypothetical protein
MPKAKPRGDVVPGVARPRHAPRPSFAHRLQDQIKKLIAKVPRVERRHIPNEMLQSGSHPLMRVAPMLPEFKYRSEIAVSIWDRRADLGSLRRSRIAASIWDRSVAAGLTSRKGVGPNRILN